MSIKVDKVSKLYGAQKALDEVVMNIDKGEVVGLLGPNGAGKSTLMKIITCFIPPTSGDVKVNGFDIRTESIEVRRSVGYLPENNPLYFEMYVREYLEFIAGLQDIKGNKKDRVSQMIDLTGLGVEQKKKIGQLSKGYRQRVGLAQALIHDPEVLILDEPTSGLDPNQLVDIRSLIKEIGREKTVMLSTHIMQEVEAICDRAIIIHKGKIVADDSTGNLSKMVAGRDLITVEFKKPVEASEFLSIEGVLSSRQESPNVIIIETDRGIDIRESVFRYAVDKDMAVLAMSKKEQRLEEAFHLLTRS